MKEKLQKILKDKKVSYLIIIALIGLLLLILGNAFQSEPKNTVENEELQIKTDEEEIKETSSDEQDSELVVEELEASFEKDLKEMLGKIQGVSEVDVMINLDSTNIKVYEKNLIHGQQTTDETDDNGGVRKVEDHTEETDIVLVRQGEQEVPLLVQTKKPEVRGVVVVAKGVDHETVKMWVTESVSKVLDVPTHRVSVMPKN